MLALLTWVWMFFKGLVSRALQPRLFLAPLPSFATPQALAAYLATNFKYTWDLWGGLLDNYTHPANVNYWIVHNIAKGLYGDAREWPLRVDCDDVSAFAYLAARQMPGVYRAQMYVFRYQSIWAALVDLVRNIRERRAYWLYFHEGCLIWHTSGTYLLDPSGLHPVRDEWEAAVLVGRMYDVVFVPQATPYPFKEAPLELEAPPARP
jgi:hypothetical protein